MNNNDSRHRAKVYCLNDEGQWDDRGTGQAFVQYMPVRFAAEDHCKFTMTYICVLVQTCSGG